MTTLDWRASQRMRKTFLADIGPARDVILFRSLDPYWAWAVRDHSGAKMVIMAEGKHRNRIAAAQQAADAVQAIASRDAKIARDWTVVETTINPED